MLSNIRIVLINTFHPGNIGAAARAMKNMGLSELYLVDPRCYPDPEAESRASGATDLLENATVVDTLAEAIADCPLVIGASARSRSPCVRGVLALPATRRPEFSAACRCSAARRRQSRSRLRSRRSG